jgi:outer membrane protein assembly factor BamB
LKITNLNSKKIPLFKYLLLTTAFFLIFSFISDSATYSAGVLDNASGTYTDDFANNSSVPTRSYVNVNTAEGVLQLTSASSQTTFTTPYRTEGSAITSTIKPNLLAQWDTLTVNATIPENTTLKVQLLTDYNSVWQNEILPGNEEGIDVSTNPTLDISGIPIMGCAFDPTYGVEWGCDKVSSIKVKFLMTTTDDTVTPTIDDISLSWTRTQGDLTPTTFSQQDPWPSRTGDQQGTSYTQYYNEETYPAFKWLSTTHSQDPYYQELYVLTDKLVGHVNNSFGRVFALNRDTGEELWKITANYFNHGSAKIGADGTIYAHEILGDAVKAIDTDTGEVKWLYNWMGGHGAGLVLDDNGKLYYFRDSASSTNATLYEHNSDGSIESQATLQLIPEALSDESKGVGYPIKGYNNRIYVAVRVGQDSYPYRTSEKSHLVAINTATKEIEWRYQGAFSDVIVDSDGTIYASSWFYDYENPTSEKKLYAINSDGTLKWESSRGTDDSRGFISQLMLTDDGELLSVRYVTGGDWSTKIIEITDKEDGSILNSYYPDDSVGSFQFIDGLNNFYYSSSETVDSEEGIYSTNMNYSDINGNLKWKISHPYYGSDGINDISKRFSLLSPDERGWLYGTFNKDVNDPDWNRIPEDSYAKTYALAPWTLSTSTDKSTYVPGDTIQFTVTSSMLRTNPVFGGKNKAQILLENGDIVPLVFSSTNSNRDSVWTGLYQIPEDIDLGTLEFDVEASQTYLETDTETHFEVPATESNNTGKVLSSSIEISIPSVRITDIGLISNIPDRESLTYYFTSTKPVIKGTTQANSTVTFEYDGETFTTQANQSGNFTITLDVSRGRDVIEYYSTDTSENTSATKELILIVGSENFPDWLLEKLGLIFNDENEDDTVEQPDENEPKIPEEEEDTEEENPVDEDTPPTSNTRTIKFTDDRGNPLTQAVVEIEGKRYVTDSNGMIAVEGLEDRSYSAEIRTRDGKNYNTQILGAEQGDIVVEIEGEVTNLRFIYILLFSGIGLLIIMIIVMTLKKKDATKESY